LAGEQTVTGVEHVASRTAGAPAVSVEGGALAKTGENAEKRGKEFKWRELEPGGTTGEQLGLLKGSGWSVCMGAGSEGLDEDMGDAAADPNATESEEQPPTRPTLFLDEDSVQRGPTGGHSFSGPLGGHTISDEDLARCWSAEDRPFASRTAREQPFASRTVEARTVSAEGGARARKDLEERSSVGDVSGVSSARSDVSSARSGFDSERNGVGGARSGVVTDLA
jgi:hypothetical protein